MTAERCSRCHERISGDHNAVECAVEIVCAELERRGEHDLAERVAVATDPTTPEQQAATVDLLRAWLGRSEVPS